MLSISVELGEVTADESPTRYLAGCRSSLDLEITAVSTFGCASSLPTVGCRCQAYDFPAFRAMGQPFDGRQTL